MSKPKKILISIVCPVFNERDNIHRFIDEVKVAIAHLHKFELEFVFVNDGSSDDTLQMCLSRFDRDCSIIVCDLSRNFGKEAALTAGLRMAKGQVVIPMDVDLQDPPAVIASMLERWQAGYEVVFARRIDRTTDSIWKRLTASLFYKVHNILSRHPIPSDVGDFRLMDRIVVDVVNSLNERNRFMKGLLSWGGFRSTCVDYSRPKRNSGSTKFNFIQLLGLAIEGITSFSIVPLKLCSYLGALIALSSFSYAVFIMARLFIQGADVPGYASIIVAISLLGGIQLLGIGLLGEYIGRTYFEVKGRPLYVIRHVHTITSNSC